MIASADTDSRELSVELAVVIDWLERCKNRHKRLLEETRAAMDELVNASR